MHVAVHILASIRALAGPRAALAWRTGSRT
jgi:hypothetical protein